MRIKENIRALRKTHNLSQKDLALIAGVSDKAVSSWESGEKIPRMHAIQKIANHFELQISDIIEGDTSSCYQSNSLSKNIKNRREELNLTQRDLAKLIGYKSHTTIAKIESGTNDVSYSNIIAFAKILDTTPNALMGLPDEINVSTSTSSEIIKTRRIGLGLTLKEIADAVGVNEATVSRWEAGNIENMRCNRIGALSKILQLPPSVILGLDDYDSIFYKNNIDAITFVKTISISPKLKDLMNICVELSDLDIDAILHIANRMRKKERGDID